jgi:signal transduction histidine kinase
MRSTHACAENVRHAGHEIRNPLHGISAGVEACLSGELSPEESHTELVAISDGVAMMSALTNDLMDLQKMRMGKFSVQEAPAKTHAMIDGCVRAVQPAVHVPIVVEIAANVPEVRTPRLAAAASAASAASAAADNDHRCGGPRRVALLLPARGWHAQIIITDDMRVRQIIMNGLTNAAKYSNPPLNGAIRVVASIEIQFDDVDQVPAGLRDSFRRGNRGKLSGAPRATTTAVAAYSGTVPDAESPRQSWLCIDVLDCGPGLQGVSEKVIFTDFACPVMMSPVPNNNHVGSSGVGLPICARYGWQCVLRRIFTLKVSVFVLVSYSPDVCDCLLSWVCVFASCWRV